MSFPTKPSMENILIVKLAQNDKNNAKCYKSDRILHFMRQTFKVYPLFKNLEG